MAPDYGRSSPSEDQRRRDQLLRKAAQEEREEALARKAREQAGALAAPIVKPKPPAHPEPAAEPTGPSGPNRPAGPRGAAVPAETKTPKGSSPTRLGSYRQSVGEPVVPAYPSRFDFHTHSRRSDGVMEPADLVAAAAIAGVRALALTDHDTLAGVRELTAPGATPLPLELIPGVEINSIVRDSELPEGELHMLGLGVDVNDEQFEATLVKQRDFRVTRFHRIVDRLRVLGYPIDEQVDQYLATQGGIVGASMGRPQIARCLVGAGFARNVDDAMRRLLLRGKPAYVPREGLGPVEAISAIRGAGGLPSLAHFSEADRRFETVKELATLGLGALEVNYLHFDAETTASVGAVARDLRLIPTGGSDYHGDTGTYAESHRGLFIPDQTGMDLLSAIGRPRIARSLEPARS